ncbi:hypothetical protein [Eubacterium aggregans]|uniref:hypothetical protein n=1 Tax=Eubacterium aggregans TaxID=81409 RepID=UPI003F31F898
MDDKALEESDRSNTRAVLSDRYNLTESDVQRYLRCRYCIEEVLMDLDSWKLAFSAAYHIYFLAEANQKLLIDAASVAEIKLTATKAKLIKENENNEVLSAERILEILEEAKPAKKPGKPKVIIKPKVIKQFFEDEPIAVIEQRIQDAIALHEELIPTTIKEQCEMEQIDENIINKENLDKFISFAMVTFFENDNNLNRFKALMENSDLG